MAIQEIYIKGLDRIFLNLSGGGGGTNYQTVQVNGVALAQEPVLNFVGTGIVGADDAGNTRSNITIAPTLQNVYDNSATPAIIGLTTDKTVSIRDNATPSTTANLLEITADGGDPNIFFAVDAYGDIQQFGPFDLRTSLEGTAPAPPAWLVGGGNVGLQLWNVSPADAVNTVQNSPIIWQRGQAWNTTSLASKETGTLWVLQSLSANPTSQQLLLRQRGTDGGAFATTHMFGGDGLFTLIGANAGIAGTYTLGGTPTLASDLTTTAFVGPNYGGTSTNVPTVTWTAPTLLNSWVNFGAPYPNAGYYKDALGVVHVRGLVKGGTTGSSIIFTLPVGYRPTATRTWPGYSGGNGGLLVQVDSSGNVSYVGGTSAPSTSSAALDMISFVAEQ